MTTISNENIVAFDCDDTLLMWNTKHNTPQDGYLEFEDPYDNNRKVYLKPHKVHLRLMRNYKSRGASIVVWSHQGYKWCEEVVKKLGIAEYVDVIMTKPGKHFDDKEDKESIIGVRLYFKDEE